MTLIEIKNYIFTHLMTESTFSLADDIASIKFAKDELTETFVQHKVGIFKTALSDLAKQGIISEIEGSPGVYILAQPLNSYSQTVILPPIVAEMVGDLVDGFADALSGEDEGDHYTVNKMQITGDDIGRLCHICHMILDEGPPPAGQQAGP